MTRFRSYDPRDPDDVRDSRAEARAVVAAALKNCEHENREDLPRKHGGKPTSICNDCGKLLVRLSDMAAPYSYRYEPINGHDCHHCGGTIELLRALLHSRKWLALSSVERHAPAIEAIDKALIKFASEQV